MNFAYLSLYTLVLGGLTYVSYLTPDQTLGFYSHIAIKSENIKNMKHMSTEFAESLKNVSRLNCVLSSLDLIKNMP